MPTSFTEFSPGDYILDTHIEQFIEPIQSLETGASWFATATGATPNLFLVGLTPAPASYTAGMIVHFKSHIDVTGAASINVNGLGAKSMLKEGSASLVSGDIIADQVVSAIYDGTNFQLLSPVLHPTTTTSPPTHNVLVYSEVCSKATTSTTKTLPDFTFSSSKLYLLEMAVGGAESSASVKLTLNIGSTDYVFPSTLTVGGRSAYAEATTFFKLLPTLSGTHNVDLTVANIGHVTVRLYEVYDNLVYADFCPLLNTATMTSYALEDFVAATGHIYEMVVTAGPYNSADPGISVYLTDGTDFLGIPADDPVAGQTLGAGSAGQWQMSKYLSGLSGSYDVFVRRANCAGASVRIYDIT